VVVLVGLGFIGHRGGLARCLVVVGGVGPTNTKERWRDHWVVQVGGVKHCSAVIVVLGAKLFLGGR